MGKTELLNAISKSTGLAVPIIDLALVGLRGELIAAIEADEPVVYPNFFKVETRKTAPKAYKDFQTGEMRQSEPKKTAVIKLSSKILDIARQADYD